MFRWIPLWQRWLRLQIFMTAENESNTYFPSPEGVKARLAAEEESKEYILSRTPEKYWQFIVPNFPLGIPPPETPGSIAATQKRWLK